MMDGDVVFYKVVIIGPERVGKTSFLRSLLGSSFSYEYNMTLFVDTKFVLFHTNYGKICLNVWDTGGQESFRTISHKNYQGADGAIIMSDKNRLHVHYLLAYINDFKIINPNKPFVVCQTKSDLTTPDEHEISKDIFQCNISSKNNNNILHPIIQIIRQITNHHDLIILKKECFATC